VPNWNAIHVDVRRQLDTETAAAIHIRKKENWRVPAEKWSRNEQITG